MEPEAKKFLLKIVNSLAVGLLWLIINATLGIFLEYAIIKDGLCLANILFYCWFLLSLALLIVYYYRLWKEIF